MNERQTAAGSLSIDLFVDFDLLQKSKESIRKFALKLKNCFILDLDGHADMT